jgi:hypothetical protein
VTAMENDDGIEVRSPDNHLIHNTTTLNLDEASMSKTEATDLSATG